MTLLRVILIHFIALSFLTSCKNSENEKLRSEVDSLRTQLKVAEQAVYAIKEISGLLDSIDVERSIIRIEMTEGMSYNTFTTRMEGVLGYVKKSEQKINDLQQKLKEVYNEKSAYSMMIEALKSELEIATDEITALQEQVKNVEEKNTKLVSLVHVQQSQLAENQVKIESTKQELALFENKIHKLMLEAKVSEADAYYARAEAVYEAAQRTKLAPRKKKETIREALELYKKSLSLGKTEAQARITELEKKM